MDQIQCIITDLTLTTCSVQTLDKVNSSFWVLSTWS